MRSSGHLHSSTIVLVIIFHITSSITIFEGSLFLIGSLLLDGDFIVSKKLFHLENHRNFLSHQVLLYIILIPVTLLFHSILFWLVAGSFFHLMFDLFDWGLPIWPSNFVTPHFLEVPSVKQEKYFFKTYFQNKMILSLEIIFLVGFILSLTILNIYVLYLVIVMELFVISEFLYQLSHFFPKSTNHLSNFNT